MTDLHAWTVPASPGTALRQLRQHQHALRDVVHTLQGDHLKAQREAVLKVAWGLDNIARAFGILQEQPTARHAAPDPEDEKTRLLPRGRLNGDRGDVHAAWRPEWESGDANRGHVTPLGHGEYASTPAPGYQRETAGDDTRGWIVRRVKSMGRNRGWWRR